MSDTELEVGVVANTNNADRDFKKVADSFELISGALRDLVPALKSAASGAEKISKNLNGVGTTNSKAAKGVQELTQAYQEQAKAQKNALSITDKRSSQQSGQFSPVSAVAATTSTRTPLLSTGQVAMAKAYGSQVTAISEREASISKALQAQLDARRQAVTLAKQQRVGAQQALAIEQQAATLKSKLGVLPSKSGSAVQTGTGPGSAQAVAQRMQNAELAVASARVAELRKNFGQYNDQLANTRYAMYGLSNSLGIAGAALLVMNVGILKTAADFQTYNANIERTSQTSGAELANLEAQFVQLGQTIPTSFDDLGTIETLGGQLGIASSQLTDFTKVTAQFSATTGVTAEASATALGRLNQLIPDVNGNFEGLASSVLKVGLNSVATENDIISVSSQIASAGVTAGLTGDQIIGFSGAFSSLGIKAEAARGTVIRVFGLMGKAVAKGGADLEEYAKIAGVSADEFAKSWGTSAFSGNFVKFLDGVNSQGTKAQLALAGLGITAARDQNNLLKLSQNTDLVNSSLSDAATGFADASQLGTSFGKIAATVASQAKELWNTLQGLFAELGSTGLGFIGGFIGMLKDMAVGFTELAKNPFVKGIVTMVGAFTALTGVALLLSSGVLKVIAAFLAGRPVINLFNQTMTLARAEIEKTRIANGLTATSFNTLKASAIAAGVAVKGALVSTLVGAGIVVALAGISAAWESVAKATRSAADAGKEAFGDGSDLQAALQKDTEAVAKGAESYNTLHGSVQVSSKSMKDWAIATEVGTGGQIALGDATTQTTQYVKDQTFAVGENTRQLLANQLANNAQIQALVQGNAKLNSSAQFNTTGFLTKLAKADTTGAKKVLDDYIASASKTLASQVGKSTSGGALSGEQIKVLTENVANAKEALKSLTGYIETATTKQQIMGIVAGATGVKITQMGDDADGAVGGLDNASSAVDTLTQSITNAFSVQNGVSQLAQDFYTLAYSIITSGTSFDAFNQTGQANLAALQSSIGSIIVAGAEMGLSATQSVIVLFDQLQKSGVDTANLLASLANINIPGLDIGAVSSAVDGTTQLSAAQQQLNAQLDGVRQAANNAAQSIGGSGGVGDAAKKAAKEVRTLGDYANDLSGVLTRAFDIRYGAQTAYDQITTATRAIVNGFKEADQKVADARVTLAGLKSDLTGVVKNAYNDEFASQLSTGLSNAFNKAFARTNAADNITKSFTSLTAAIADSKQKLIELQAQMQQLSADKSSAEYWLGVANDYGDTARASQLKAQIADITAQQSAAQAQIVTEQNNQSRSLIGNSAAAIKNRDELSQLVSQYQAYVQAMSDTGASSKDIAKALADSKAQFIAQGKTLGFSDLQLSTFASTFNSFSTANANAAIEANRVALQKQADAQAAVTKAAAELKTAQDAASRSLVGNSDAAIANRAAVTNLISKENDYIVALANAGISQANMQRASAALRTEFGHQLSSVGVATSSINKYAGSFNDVRTAINSVPKNVTVGFNPNPAIQALNEMKAKAGSAAYDSGAYAGRAFANGFNRNNTALGDGITDAIKNSLRRAPIRVGVNGISPDGTALFHVPGTLINFFKTGGYTGDVGNSQPAGIVHGKEYVIDAPNTARLGVPFLDALNSGRTPAVQAVTNNIRSAGNSGAQLVELTAGNLARIADAVSVQLQIGNKTIASASNSANLNASKRGAN